MSAGTGGRDGANRSVYPAWSTVHATRAVRIESIKGHAERNGCRPTPAPLRRTDGESEDQKADAPPVRDHRQMTSASNTCDECFDNLNFSLLQIHAKRLFWTSP